MTKESRLKKKKKNKRVKIILAILVLLYLLFRIIPILNASNRKTFAVERDVIEIFEETTGILFKQEILYQAKNPGKLSTYIEEGTRIGKGTRVAQVSIKSTDELEKQLEEIDNTIEELESSNLSKGLFKGDIEKNQAYIDDLSTQLQKAINDRDYARIDQLKSELDSRVNKQKTMSGQNSYNAGTIENLKSKKEILSKEIQNSSIVYYSEYAGILTYCIDGLENVYSMNKLENLNTEEFNILETKDIKIENENELKLGDPIYKIVDNFKWYLAIKLINEKNIKDLEIGKYLAIRSEKIDEDLKGKVIKIDKKEHEAMIVLEFDSYLANFYESRFLDVKVIFEKHEGLKIPSNSIVKKDDTNGVYIKDVSGIIKFRPVKILGKDEEFTIVDEGDGINYNYIECQINGQPTRKLTISLYDEVFVNTSNIEEGQIIN